MNAALLLARCWSLGLTLRAKGNRLAVRPAYLATPALLAELRTAKPQLLNLLKAGADPLSPEHYRCRHIARQVLAGEFDGGNRSTLERVFIRIKYFHYPLGQSARIRLEIMLGWRKEIDP
jgi:hypothetical protein